jgi:hypothetical protein
MIRDKKTPTEHATPKHDKDGYIVNDYPEPCYRPHDPGRRERLLKALRGERVETEN